MADLLFPAPPLTIGQQYAAPNGVIYTWDGAVWASGVGFTALWHDDAAAATMAPIHPDRSLLLGASTAIHFGNPTAGCPCLEAAGDDLTLEVQGACHVKAGDTNVATFDATGLTVLGTLIAPARPGATLVCAVPISDKPQVGTLPVATNIAAVESLLAEWTVPEQTGRPLCTFVHIALTIQNIQGGIQQVGDSTLSLRRGGTAGGVDGTVVATVPPLPVAVPQNALVPASETFSTLTTPTATASVRWSVTGRNPNAAKFAVQMRRVTGVALGFA